MPLAPLKPLRRWIWRAFLQSALIPLVLVESCGYWMVPVTMIGAYAMLGLEMIGNEIENPFGYDSNDLPITQLSTATALMARYILACVVLRNTRSTCEASVSAGNTPSGT